MEFNQKLPIVLSLEKDDPRNITGMQLRVWRANNGTTIFMRVFKHSEEATKKLWDGKRTLSEADDLILQALQDWRLIKEPENWDYSVSGANDFGRQDPHEEKDQCMHFCWHVKRHLIDKF